MTGNYPIPYGLTEDGVRSQLQHCHIEKLKELASRGIYLNTWQTAEYILGNIRNVGRTTLAFINIAEECKRRGITLDESSPLSRYDRDVKNRKDRQIFLTGLRDFLEEYYKDVYDIKKLTSSELIATPKCKASNRGWWI